MGYRTAELPPVDLDEFAKMPFFERMKMLQLHWVQYGFGTPEADGQLLRVEDLLLRAVRADHLRRVHQGARVRQHRRLVGRADPLPEADGLDDPAGDPRARRDVRPVGVPLRSADRRRPVLVAERHDPGPPVSEPRAVHQGQPADAVGHRAVQAHRVLAGDDAVPVRRTGRRPADGLGRRDAAVGAGHLLLPDHPDGPPRQDRVPVGALGAVRADDAVLRTVRQLPRHDRRRQDLHRRDLDGRRLLEAAARVLVDGGDHGAEHAVDGVAEVPHGDGQGLPERHPAVEGDAPAGPHRRHDVRDRHAAGAAVLAVAVADVDRDHLDLDAPHRSSSPPSRWRCRWSGTCSSCSASAFLFAQLPGERRLRGRRHEPGTCWRSSSSSRSSRSSSAR